jgi:hypothetical protein
VSILAGIRHLWEGHLGRAVVLWTIMTVEGVMFLSVAMIAYRLVREA